MFFNGLSRLNADDGIGVDGEGSEHADVGDEHQLLWAECTGHNLDYVGKH